ncbi:MAG: class I SAM-dependent methyltransferase [Waterburya sp.]
MMMKTKTSWISCNVCGADAFKKLSTVEGWNIGKCTKCSQVYLNPMPFFEPSAEFSDMSMDFQYTRFQHSITEETERILQHDKQQFSLQIEEMSKFSGRTVKPGNFLDIGCGSGGTVRVAQDLGWNAVGIDIDPQLVALGKEQLNVDLRASSLLDSGFEANQFHFIRLRDVIEHLPNPYEVLIEIKRLLVPGGFALIATPNEAALTTEIRLAAGFKRDKIATVKPPHHVHGFSPKTLKQILERAGLQIYCIKTTTPVDSEYVTARNMEMANSQLHVFVWRTANLLGKGSMLIGWVGKEA